MGIFQCEYIILATTPPYNVGCERCPIICRELGHIWMSVLNYCNIIHVMMVCITRPVFTVTVASHIRLRAVITVLHLDATVLHRDAEHRGEGRNDHRSRPDV